MEGRKERDFHSWLSLTISHHKNQEWMLMCTADLIIASFPNSTQAQGLVQLPSSLQLSPPSNRAYSNLQLLVIFNIHSTTIHWLSNPCLPSSAWTLFISTSS